VRAVSALLVDSVFTTASAGRHVLEALKPYSTANGGPLTIRKVAYVEGRGNILVSYPGTDAVECTSFVGMHLDVVPANPDTWTFPAFELTREGDKLRGRGVTDCLGHVALVTRLLVALAKAKPVLRRTVHAVFIANEENSSTLGVGIDALVANGELDALKAGPVLWVDTADSTPCIGTGGIAAWSLTASGKLFHSGIPQNAINAIELGSCAVTELQRRFNAKFPAHPQEKVYGYACASSMKPTQVSFPGGSVNQIPGQCTFSGDVRVTPFYKLEDVVAAIDADVADINANLETALTPPGPHSRFVLPGEGLRGKLAMTWGEGTSRGLACDLSSPGYTAMRDAFTEVAGKCAPIAITGTLPCIADLQAAGFDVQCLGFGLLKTYHANDEYGLLSDFARGFRVLSTIIANLERLVEASGEGPSKRARH